MELWLNTWSCSNVKLDRNQVSHSTDWMTKPQSVYQNFYYFFSTVLTCFAPSFQSNGMGLFDENSSKNRLFSISRFEFAWLKQYNWKNKRRIETKMPKTSQIAVTRKMRSENSEKRSTRTSIWNEKKIISFK